MLARFGTAAESVLDSPIQVHVLPDNRMLDNGAYSATLQIVVPGRPGSAGTWDILASFISPAEERQNYLGTVTVEASEAAFVLERKIEFRPGPYEIAALAHHRSTGRVTSRFVSVSWPDIEEHRTIIGPIAVLQESAPPDRSAGNSSISVRFLPRSSSSPVSITCAPASGALPSAPSRH